MPERMTTKLKHLFERPEITVLPGGTTPYHAILTEKAGYEGFYMSGGMTSRWLIGWTDVGATTLREMADNANRIAKCINIPVFADIDTGYGTAVNTYRSIKEYVWAGVAGCHLEDQEFPKKSGTMAGRRLISIEEMVGKIKAAVDAKKELDPDFVLVARTDARGAEGGSLEEVLKRGKIYKEEAGADAIMIDTLQSWEECEIALKEIPGPTFCLLSAVTTQRDASGNFIPILGPTLEEQEKAGQAIALEVPMNTMSASQAEWELLMDFKERGVQAIYDYRISIKDRKYQLPTDPLAMTGKQVRELEEKYLPKHLQRDYDNTIGAMPDGSTNRP